MEGFLMLRVLFAIVAVLMLSSSAEAACGRAARQQARAERREARGFHPVANTVAATAHVGGAVVKAVAFPLIGTGCASGSGCSAGSGGLFHRLRGR
jgi:uncharacterized MAPEG superfamily protein